MKTKLSILKIAGFVAAMSVTQIGLASQSTGKVTAVWQHYNTASVSANSNIFLFQVENAQLTACATSQRYAVDISTNRGKAVMANILTARVLGLPVQVVGTNACDTHGDAETVSYIAF